MSAYDPNDPDMQYLAVDRKKLMKEQADLKFDAKKACWAPDPEEGFRSAELQSTKGEEVTVTIVGTNEVGEMLFLTHCDMSSLDNFG